MNSMVSDEAFAAAVFLILLGIVLVAAFVGVRVVQYWIEGSERLPLEHPRVSRRRNMPLR